MRVVSGGAMSDGSLLARNAEDFIGKKMSGTPPLQRFRRSSTVPQ